MRSRGFTLVEVMVALAVVAVAVPALLVALYQQVDDTGYLRDKTLAQMVASNKLAEMRLVVAATRELKKKKRDGRAEFADREWFWRTEIAPTDVDKFFRLTVKVSAEEDEKVQPLYTLVAYMSADVQTAAPVAASNVEDDDNDSSSNNDDSDRNRNSNSNNSNNLPDGLSTEGQQLLDAIQNAR